uniref:Uncharacterized protein n=1 Tax=Solibacter usitatus (strain Ellin6076) TaxID=234267 RepID=Q02BZ9_SOLUE
MQKTVLLAKATLSLALLNAVMADDAPRPGLHPEIATDRPHFTDSTGVVGKGVVQVENGLTGERGRDGSNLSGPELLMRIGLNERLEFRIGDDGFLSHWAPGTTSTSGHSNIELAVKVVVFEQGRYRPAMSLDS